MKMVVLDIKVRWLNKNLKWYAIRGIVGPIIFVIVVTVVGLPWSG